jgi:hypothetical protein
MPVLPLQIALQLAAFPSKNRLKYAVFCAKRGERLAGNTATSAQQHFREAPHAGCSESSCATQPRARARGAAELYTT